MAKAFKRWWKRNRCRILGWHSFKYYGWKAVWFDTPEISIYKCIYCNQIKENDESI